MLNARYDRPMSIARKVVRALAGAVFAMGCGGPESSLKADLEPTQGHDVRGTVLFEPAEGGVRVRADVRGLGGGRHGFHVHEVGDCSAPDASSAGGHFNPTGALHGAPDAKARHAGDLGNLEASTDGVARYERIDPMLALSGPDSILGRSVVVHAGSDDLTSQPSGAAGPRVACGVIAKGR